MRAATEGHRSPARVAMTAVRVLRRFALALLTVLVCAGIVSVGRASTSSILATANEVAFDGPALEHRPSAPGLPQWRQDGRERLDFEAVESDPDEEDSRYEARENLSLAFCFLPVSPVLRVGWRRERGARETSRFFASAGIPRGPPV